MRATPVELSARAESAPSAGAAASQPASRPAGRDVPVYTRAEMAAVLKVAERDKGAIAKQRDEAREGLKLSELYAERLAVELQETQARAAWLPWVIGGAAALGGALVGLVVGAVLESNKRSPQEPSKNAPLVPLGAW